MGTQNTIDITQLSSWAAAQQRAFIGMGLGKTLKVIATLMAAKTKENFQASRSPEGKTWAPLLRPRSGKRHKKSTPKPLLDRGLLQASISSRSAAGHIEEINDYGIEFGTNLNYAGYHQHGTKNMVARPFLGFNDELLTQIDKILGEHIEQGIVK